MLTLAKRPLLALIPVVAALTACGGGGGGGSGGGTPATGTGSTSPPGWVAGQFAASSSFAALCVSPRTGVDPSTQQTYPDRPGSALDEKNWLRSWTNELYLWFDEVTDQDPAGFATDAAYFDVLKTTAVTPSGKDKDRFHFTYPTATWESLSQSGVQAELRREFRDHRRHAAAQCGRGLHRAGISGGNVARQSGAGGADPDHRRRRLGERR